MTYVTELCVLFNFGGRERVEGGGPGGVGVIDAGVPKVITDEIPD